MNGLFRKIAWISCLCCCLCFLLGNLFSVAADDIPMVTEDTFSEISEPTVTEANGDPDPQPIQITVNSPLEGEYTLTSEDTHITTISASDATGFKAVILGLFGDYEMITKEYTYTSTQGYTSKQVTTESDYPWIISAAIFTVVLYCLFRMIGGVLCGRK